MNDELHPKVVELAEKIGMHPDGTWGLTRQEVFHWVILYPFALGYLREALVPLLAGGGPKALKAEAWARAALDLWAADLQSTGRLV